MSIIFKEGFESGQWTHRVKVFPVGGDPYETEIGNIFTPKDWLAWYLHEPGTWDQPEGRNTWGYVDTRRIHSGDGAYVLFSVWRHHDAGLMRQVQAKPGTKLRLTAWAHAWSNTSLEGHEDCCDDGRCSCGVGREVVAIPVEDIPEPNGDPWNDAIGNSIFVLGIDPNGGEDPFSLDVEWGPAFAIYNGYAGQLEAEAVVGTGGTVTVFLRHTTLYNFKHNDGYWDDVVLETPGAPPYESTMLVLPQDATPGQLQEIFALAFPDRRTFGFSHDDAGNLNGTSICYNISDADKQAYLDFYASRYPDVTVEFAYTSDWEEPGGLLLKQCDPRWGDEKIAGPDCSLTLCQTGCWVSDCAMAQRFFDIKADATPSTANQALGAVGGFSGCNTKWSAMKTALKLEVFERHYSDQRARDWIDGGFVCFAEVEPEAYQHFVLVTKHSEGRFWMLDPYKGVEGWLDEHYSGVDSWRSVCPFESTPPSPPVGNPIGLHLQSMSAGWDTYVREAKPNVTKVLASMHDVLGVKSLQPDALVVWRHVDNDYGGILDNPDPHEGARRWIAKFRDSLFARCEELEQILEITKPYFYVESINEVYPSRNAAAVIRAANFDIAFIEELAALDLPLRAVVFTAGIGNPHESEYELLVPLARKAEQYEALMGYHGYFWVDHGVSHLESDWEWHAGRWVEMDKVFVQHGVHVKWFGAEGGAHFDCSSGWKKENCLNGDWEAYKALLLQWKAKIDEWNVGHGNRYLGQVLFTTGGSGWASWEIQAPEMKSLADVL